MPYLEMDTTAGKKRKRPAKALKPSKSQQPKEALNHESRIVELESQILKSRKHYNNIATLISLAKESSEATLLVNIALCRVYCRFLAAGNLSTSKETTGAEAVIVQWLRARLNEYVDILLELLRSESTGVTALTLLMRLVKEEVNQRGHMAWSQGIFGKATGVLLSSGEVLSEFEVKYFNPYADVRFHTLELVTYVARSCYIYGSAPDSLL
jgi:U3 small nucleolar RNA-associated protein 19